MLFLGWEIAWNPAQGRMYKLNGKTIYHGMKKQKENVEGDDIAGYKQQREPNPRENVAFYSLFPR